MRDCLLLPERSTLRTHLIGRYIICSVGDQFHTCMMSSTGDRDSRTTHMSAGGGGGLLRCSMNGGGIIIRLVSQPCPDPGPMVMPPDHIESHFRHTNVMDDLNGQS